KYRKRSDDDCALAPQHRFKRAVHRGSAQDAALTEIDVCELRVGIGKCELHRTSNLGPAAPNLGKRIFEPVRNIDTGTLRDRRLPLAFVDRPRPAEDADES